MSLMKGGAEPIKLLTKKKQQQLRIKERNKAIKMHTYSY